MESFFFFGGFEIIFFIVFFSILAFFVFLIIKGIGTWHRNNHSPQLTVDASLISKRIHVSHHNNGNDHMMTHGTTRYYVTFQVESGDRIEFLVEGKEYGLLAESDCGKLSFQGSRYLRFDRL